MINDWQNKLSMFAAILDNWLNVQRNWIYLEGIFNAADIQRQLPTEAKLFNQIDKNFSSMKTDNIEFCFVFAANIGSENKPKLNIVSAG